MNRHVKAVYRHGAFVIREPCDLPQESEVNVIILPRACRVPLTNPAALLSHPPAHRIVARFLQKCSRLSVPPNKVVKIVESASRISPPRVPFGGIQMNELNSRFPAAVNGCGRVRSMGCLLNT